MPIKECTLPEGGTGYQWGDHGKCYPHRHQAEEQAAAAHANGYTGDDFTSFFAPGKISTKQSLTPEGFLLCEEVPIARTGTMPYADGELKGLTAGSDGLVWITRTDEVLFHPDAIASFNGKPVTDGHPEQMVSPLTWKGVAVGTAHNVRRGSGIFSDCLVADFLITDAEAIDEIQKGLREVSAGYDADYEQLTAGRGFQRQIIGNHIALVKKGRCGPRCAIGDESMADKSSWKDKVRDRLKAVFSNDEAQRIMEMIPESDVPSINIYSSAAAQDNGGVKTTDEGSVLKSVLEKLDALDARVTKLTTKDSDEDDKDDKKKTEDEDEDEEEDGKKKTEDGDDDGDDDKEDHEQMTGDTFQKVSSMAEILSPGIEVKTCDSAVKCMRNVLGKAYTNDSSKKVIDLVLGGRKATFDKMPANVVKAIFNGSVALMKERNNSTTRDAAFTTARFAGATNDANTRNKEFWEKRGVRY